MRPCRRPQKSPWSFALGKIAGVQLQVHVTVAVLLGWIAIRTVQAGGGWRPAVSALLLTIALFFTVFLHELGHALVDEVLSKLSEFSEKTDSVLMVVDHHGATFSPTTGATALRGTCQPPAVQRPLSVRRRA